MFTGFAAVSVLEVVPHSNQKLSVLEGVLVHVFIEGINELNRVGVRVEGAGNSLGVNGSVGAISGSEGDFLGNLGTKSLEVFISGINSLQGSL